jgi:hypothetical protein
MFAEKNVVVLLDTDTIGWSTTSNDGVRRFRKRRKITPKTTARMIPPMIQPAMAGVLGLLEGVEGGDGVAEARLEVIMGVGGATSKSGLTKNNEAIPNIDWQEGILALYSDRWEGPGWEWDS